MNLIRDILSKRTHGQAVILVAVLLTTGVLLGFVALAIDGGSALVQRRVMQNRAESASLAAAQTLAASVVLSSGVGTYVATNGVIQSRVYDFLKRNSGNTIDTSAASTQYVTYLDYGTFVSNTNTYNWTQVATNTINASTASTWTSAPGYLTSTLVPATTDAIRIRARVDNPTSFARLLNIRSIPVQASAAASLQTVVNHQPQGPTWPMVTVASPTPDPNTGLCNPVLFWSSTAGSGNFKNLIQLGARQGKTYEGGNASTRHFQLIHAHDEGDPTSDFSGQMDNACGSTLWIPGGNCGNLGIAGHGEECCSGSANNAKVDVPNWIYHNFNGLLSTTSTAWWDSGDCSSQPCSTPPTHDWRSLQSQAEGITGDWPEVYQGGNLGNNIASAIQANITRDGVPDPTAPSYGLYVEKVMYHYDLFEAWGTPPGCGQPCTQRWFRVGAVSNAMRVHITQPGRFRFYYNLAGSSTGSVQKPPICTAGGTINVGNSEVYGVYVGETVNEPPCSSPPCNVGHGLDNYVGYIDP